MRSLGRQGGLEYQSRQVSGDDRRTGDEAAVRIGERSRTRREGWLLAAVLLLVVAMRIPSFWEPIGTDQAISAVIADSLRQGQVFYRDVWDHHTPLEFYIHAAGQLLFGSSTRTVYLLDLLWTLANGLALYGLARRLHGWVTALLGMGLYLLFSNSVAFNQDLVGTWTFRFKPEGLMILPCVVGLYACLRAADQAARRPWLWWGMAGLSLGLATALKPVGALFLIGGWVVMVVAAWHSTKSKLAAAVRGTLWLAGGALAAQLVYLVPTAAQGTLRDFWQAVVLYNFGPYSQLGLSTTRFATVSLLVGKETFVLWLLAMAGCGLMLWRDRRCGNGLLVGWLLLSGVVLIVQNRYYAYQYQPLLPPLCLLAAYGAAQLWRWASGRQAVTWSLRAVVLLLLAASVARFASTNAMYYDRFLRLASGRVDAATFYEAFNTYPRHYSFPADQAVADWVRQRTAPHEPLGTLGGYGATPVYLAGRPPASRYVFTYHLFHPRTADHPMVQAMRDQLLADLQASQPPYMLLLSPPGEFAKFASLSQWLLANYELEREFPQERFLYRRVVHR
jgi:4-amino-4-deoxy-L-arabinose transferase-like glycosyltransferase